VDKIVYYPLTFCCEFQYNRLNMSDKTNEILDSDGISQSFFSIDALNNSQCVLTDEPRWNP